MITRRQKNRLMEKSFGHTFHAYTQGKHCMLKRYISRGRTIVQAGIRTKFTYIDLDSLESNTLTLGRIQVHLALNMEGKKLLLLLSLVCGVSRVLGQDCSDFTLGSCNFDESSVVDRVYEKYALIFFSLCK